MLPPICFMEWSNCSSLVRGKISCYPPFALWNGPTVVAWLEVRYHATPICFIMLTPICFMEWSNCGSLVRGKISCYPHLLYHANPHLLYGMVQLW